MELKRKRVVVTGMGILSSIADNVEDFKQALFDRKCGIKPSEKYLEWFENANASEILQDLSWPTLSDETVKSMDKAALWAYRVGSDALKQAKLDDEQHREKTALIVGVSSAGTEAFIPLIEHKLDQFSLNKALISGSFSSCSAIVSSLLGLQGGFELIATACTASTNAVGMGFDFIQNNKNKTVLIVGTEPIYLPTFAGFYALQAMKKTPSSPFSGLPGMSIGEGAGALLLEDYDHAVARGATIYGEIFSYATSCDAYHETAPDPRAEGAVQVMNSALNNANLTSNDINYINAHGTGTEANDRCETLAMKKVFPNILDIPISSTKSYVGHNIGSAGIIELLACFLTLPEKKILPTLNFTEPRLNCDLNYVPNEFITKDVKFFMKNNYAFGGNNCSVVAGVKSDEPHLSTYEAKKVYITGVGSITSIAHTFTESMDKLWSGDFNQEFQISQVSLDCDVEKDIKLLIESLSKNKEVMQFCYDKFGQENIEDYLATEGVVHKINNLDARKILRRFDPRKANQISTFALIALTQTLTDAQRKIKRDGHTLGLIMGMAKGPQSTVNKYLQSLFPDPTRVRTSEFPGSLMNAISTFCSISEGIKGYNTTLATGVNAGLGAFAYGYEIVRQGLQPQMLVGGADESMSTMGIYLESLTNELLMTKDHKDYQLYSKDKTGFIAGEGAAMFLLESKESALSRNAKVYAQVLGYGKSNDTCYFDKENIKKRSQAMQSAIAAALKEANITMDDIDLICGSSDGSLLQNKIEISAIKGSLGKNKDIPVANYNGYFGLVESSAGLLNMQILLETFQRQEILPIPYTQEFLDDEINFVKVKMKKAIKSVLQLGATEGGNYYAIVLQGVA
ncbi:beta-ketoacyl synthase N-terminal-like domain-containing protein [Thorsellia kenyensis]|uniref:Beta-ketoacyl synthase N-terminal-like domain-containing protein n=1 Tax=Thorsellia kenyensis TaxID=1549888 RepID=A0ABV6CBA9_9GAMM